MFCFEKTWRHRNFILTSPLFRLTLAVLTDFRRKKKRSKMTFNVITELGSWEQIQQQPAEVGLLITLLLFCLLPSTLIVEFQWNERNGRGSGRGSDNGDEMRAGKVVWEQMVAWKRGAPRHCWHGYKEVNVLTSCANICMFQNSVACGFKP